VVGVVHGPGGGFAAPDGHVQRVDDQFGAQVVGDRPADHEAAERVDHDRQVDLAVGGGVFGDVGAPQPVGLVGVEQPADQVVGRHRDRVAAGAAAPATAGDPVQAGGAHEPLHPFAAHPNALAEAQFGVDPRSAIGAAGLAVDLDDRLGQDGVFPGPATTASGAVRASRRSRCATRPTGDTAAGPRRWPSPCR
jgi:hypothetical protein